MQGNLMTKVASLFAVMVLPLAGFAINHNQTLTLESSQSDLSEEASSLLTRLHRDAFEVRNSADHFGALEREREADDMQSWKDDAITLENMKDQINKMDQNTYQLRNIESQLPQEQRSEINNIALGMLELTNTTQAAIRYLDNHENDLLFAPYTQFPGEIYSEAGRVETATAIALTSTSAHS